MDTSLLCAAILASAIALCAVIFMSAVYVAFAIDELRDAIKGEG